MSSCSSAARTFKQSESGSLTNLTVASSVVMLIFGGIGIDFMVAEMKRAKAQQLLDRSVLAAAALNNELDPEGVVNDYFAKAGMGELLFDVQSTSGTNFRRVWARTDEQMGPLVAHNFGVDAIDISTEGMAEQYARNVEISMVLDVSDSMNDDNRMVNMQAAARDFIKMVLDGTFPDMVSVTIVPYSEQVGIGKTAFDEIVAIRHHDASYCVELEHDDLDETNIEWGYGGYQQVQHFQLNTSAINDVSNPVCPTGAANQVLALSNDPAALTAKINGLKPLNGTAIYNGLKWGAHYLDPTGQQVVNALADNGEAPTAFRGRPLAFGSADNAKHIVLMTDGENDNTYRIDHKYYNDNSNEWTDDVDYDADGYKYDKGYWQNVNFGRHLNDLYDAGTDVSGYYWTRASAAQGDNLTRDICKAAKDNDIVIWAVGFETSPAQETLLKECATSNAHFFDADGKEIREAFTAIARSIKQVKLTQ